MARFPKAEVEVEVIALALASMTTRVAAGRQWSQDLPATPLHQ
ncbi:MAG: hypothetical protein WAK60_09325 [Sedimentisphaerales bacterium]